jgi:apolipoprotein N-acyltransferase
MRATGRPGRLLGLRLPPAESVLAGGLSALLLLIAHVYPQYDYLSLVALLPLLIGLSRARTGTAFAIGSVFGIAYFSIILLGESMSNPIAGLVWMTTAAILCGSFGAGVAWSRSRFGLSPSVVACLWVVLESALHVVGLSDGILLASSPVGSVFDTAMTAFGVIGAAALIVLFNSVTLIVITRLLVMARAAAPKLKTDKRPWDLLSGVRLFAQKHFVLPETRGPPTGPPCSCISPKRELA